MDLSINLFIKHFKIKVKCCTQVETIKAETSKNISNSVNNVQ